MSLGTSYTASKSINLHLALWIHHDPCKWKRRYFKVNYSFESTILNIWTSYTYHFAFSTEETFCIRCSVFSYITWDDINPFATGYTLVCQAIQKQWDNLNCSLLVVKIGHENMAIILDIVTPICKVLMLFCYCWNMWWFKYESDTIAFELISIKIIKIIDE